MPAALIPGLMLAGLYLVYIVVRAIIQSEPRAEAVEGGDRRSFRACELAWMMLTSFVPLAMLILAVLGAILFGLATPSEAAALGALGGIVLAAAYRALTWQRLRESVYLTVRTSAMVCWLFVGSATFASVFSYLGGQQVITEFVTGLDISPLMFLIVAQLIIFSSAGRWNGRRSSSSSSRSSCRCCRISASIRCSSASWSRSICRRPSCRRPWRCRPITSKASRRPCNCLRTFSGA